ncbi:S-layer protein domain-containing protein [Methanohalophilus portucalensis]|uniref:Fibronectin type-III domain-containing protein n=1 Tax=Methanohalophilus portucalensis TaxID=39664 RepID=A0A2D3C7Y9_9EURY|nr:S-layer protein domain-containing protein [Methanohalophilus portucalensis]ATU08847.1 hypothetical protein BKM01_08735 [Methanohalophilus portucalensis]
MFIFSGIGSATTHVVDDDGAADYNSIQVAINNAIDNDTIEVKNGTYFENVVVNKTLTLIGDTENTLPLINASGNGSAITITADNCSIQNFNVTGSGDDWNGGDADSGIKIKSENNNIVNNSVYSNNYAIYTFEVGNNSIKNNTISDNENGVYLFYSDDNLIENNYLHNSNRDVYTVNSHNNTISSNTLDSSIYIFKSKGNRLFDNLIGINDSRIINTNPEGIYLAESSDSVIINNTIIRKNKGVYFSDSDSNVIQNNTVSGNYNGIYLSDSDSSNIQNNTVSYNSYRGIYLSDSDSSNIQNNTVSHNSQSGIYLRYSYYNHITNNSVSSNFYGTYFYNSDFSNIQNNIISENSNYGIDLEKSNNNILKANNISHNNAGLHSIECSENIILYNNIYKNLNHNAYETTGSNLWISNWYGDYSGADTNDDGIGDTTYYIPPNGESKDDFPLINLVRLTDSIKGAKFSLHSGEEISLYEGYSLVPQQVSVDGNKVWMEIKKNGQYVDDFIVDLNSNFAFTLSIDGNNKLIILGRVSDISQDNEGSITFYDSFYQYSEDGAELLIANNTDLEKAQKSIAPSISITSVSDIDTNSTSVKFDVNQSDASTRIAYSTSSHLSSVYWSSWNNSTSTNRRITISGLNENTTYYYSAYAYNGTDDNSFSNTSIDSFKTADQSNDIESTVTIVYLMKESHIASTNVMKKVLERAGYEVDIIAVDVGPMYQGLADGHFDFTISARLPKEQENYWNVYNDQIISVAVNLENSQNGLAVPTYINGINSIEDLNANRELFNGKITGIEPDASIMQDTQNSIETYNLNYSLEASSSAGMSSALDAAYRSEEPIVVTLWTPHWTFERYDLKILEDPKKTYGEADHIETLSRQGLKRDKPKLYSIISNFNWSHEEIQDVMGDIESGMSPGDAASKWVGYNSDIVDKWLSYNESIEDMNHTSPSISSISISNVDTNSASISFAVNQSDAKAKLVYNTYSNLSSSSEIWDNSTSTSRNIEITGLNENTTYYYTIYAHNSTNISAFTNSSISSFETLASKAPSITDINVGNVDTNYASISFDVNQSDSATRIAYSTSPDFSVATWSAWENSTSISRSIDISGLSENTTYYYTIYAHNSTNTSVFTSSAINNFKTVSLTDPNKEVIYKGTIDSGDGYQVNNFVIDIADVFPSNDYASFYVYERDSEILGKGLDVNDNFTFEIENEEVEVKLIDTIDALIPRAELIIAINNSNIVRTQGIVDGGHENAEFEVAPSIADVNVNEIGETGANINYNVDQPNSNTKVVFSTSPTLENPNVIWDNSSTTSRSVSLVGLNFDTNYYYSVYAYNRTFPDLVANTSIGTLVTKASSYNFGNYVWDENADQSTTYTWDGRSFSGFYYDLETGDTSESMTTTIDVGGHEIEEDNLLYRTESITKEFEFNGWDEYQIIGFMAEKYFAGFENTDTSIIDYDLSLISEGILTKVLIDTDDDESVYSESSLILEEGYSINIEKINVSGDRVWINLSKNGVEVDNSSLSSEDTFVYKKDFGSVVDIPIITIHVDDIFSGTETNAVFIDGIFQISEDYVKIDEGDKYGEMEIDDVTSSKIEMSNEDDIDLGEGDIIDIMGKLKFIVADDDVLRFAPFVDISEPGAYEQRGTIAENQGSTWTPLNFEGFYYDIDEGLLSESLYVGYDGRSIDEGNLTYEATPISVAFEYANWGDYEVIGFMSEKYFAGYEDSEFGGETYDLNLMSNGHFSEVLIDDGDEKSVYTGSSLILEEGYSLEIQEVDVNGERAMIELTHNGNEVDSTIISSNDEYVYEKDIGDTDDLPLIVIHFAEIYSGTENHAVFIDGIFQISEDYMNIQDGDNFGVMTVESIAESVILENEDDVDLDEGEIIDIMGKIKFKVADDNDNIRYYPFVEVETKPDESLDIDVEPSTIVEGEEIVFMVTSRGAAIKNASILIDNEEIGTTSEKGDFEYRADDVGKFTVTAEKANYESAEGNFEVLSSNTTPVKYTMSLQKGWNLVSIPIIPANSSTESIFANNDEVLFPVYTWDNWNKQYYEVENLGVGNGYWILALNDTEVDVEGTTYNP